MHLSPEAVAEATAENTSFSKEIPGLQIAWDAHSLKTLRECPRKYALSNILGYVRKTRATPLVFGILVHKAIEVWSKLTIEGTPHNEAVAEALKIAFSQEPEAGEWINDQWIPRDSEKPQRNRMALARTIVWVLDSMQESPIETVVLPDGTPAVELSFRFATDHKTPTGENYLLCGHFDRLVTFIGQTFFLDTKTTSTNPGPSYWAQFEIDTQMTLYTLAGGVVLGQKVSGGLIQAIQLGTSWCRPLLQPIYRTKGQLAEWMDDLRHTLTQAEHYAKSNYWPPNDSGAACHKFSGCQFRDICTKDPSVRHSFLHADFERRTWDPLVPRT